jgi:hypothetical protein
VGGSILEAALGILTDRSAEGLSMSEMAARADYSPSGLYKHLSPARRKSSLRRLTGRPAQRSRSRASATFRGR